MSKRRTILLTGASGGLAQAIVAALPKDDQLILLGRDINRLKQLYGKRQYTDLRSSDLSDLKALEILIQTLYQDYQQIDVLINNAGFGLFQAYDTYDEASIDALFAVNTRAVMTLSRLLGQKMASSGSGHIVTIASMAGLMATAKASIYSASKFAVVGFSNSLRLELADAGVYVTVVNPGPIKTAFFEKADPDGNYLKRVQAFSLTPEAVARQIVKQLGKPKREINLPLSLALAAKGYALFPRVGDYLARKVFNYK